MKTLVLIMLAFSLNVFGQARKYSECAKDKKIIEPKNSQGYFFDKDCNTVYIKPPTVGSIHVSNYIQTLSDESCRSEMIGINMLNRKLKEIEKLSNILDKTNRELDRYNSQISKIKKQCNRIQDELRSIDTKLRSIDIEISYNETQLNNIKKQIESCESESSCFNIKSKMKGIEDALSTFRENKEKIVSINMKYKETERECALNRDAKIAIIENEKSDSKLEFEKLYEAQEDYNRIRRSLEDKLFNQVGGQLAISLFSGQNQLVNEFREKNSNLKVNFMPLPISNAVLSFNQIRDGNKASVPVVLQANVYGLNVVKQGETEDEAVSVEDLPASTEKDVKFGEALGGQIVINKYTACSILNLNNEQALNKIAGSLKPSVTFNYGVQVDRHLKIKYDESHLYQIIRKNSSKRGLFRSSSSSSVTEKSEAQKWIQIELVSQDENLNFEDSEKIAMDIRREFLDSALMKVARGYLSTQQANLIDPGPDGATLAAKELQKCPHMYCQFGAAVLNIGSALFGGSKSEANMTQTVSAKEAQEIIERKVVVEYGTQTLSVSGE